jgi:hypothetical protein
VIWFLAIIFEVAVIYGTQALKVIQSLRFAVPMRRTFSIVRIVRSQSPCDISYKNGKPAAYSFGIYQGLRFLEKLELPN